MKSLCVERRINATLGSVWKVVSDIGNYAQYAPNLNSSRIISGKGMGLVRECTSKEGAWQEICTEWQDHRSYQFQVQTQAEDYPFPFKTLQGKWEVCYDGNTQTVIRMTFDTEFKNVVIGWLAYPLMKRKFLLVCEHLLDNWQQAVKVPKSA